MTEKYARDKIQFSKILKYGFAIGVLGEAHNAYRGHDQSCDILDTIKEQSKFSDDYYKVYRDLSKNRMSQAEVNTFDLKKLLSLDAYPYKDMLLGSLTCSAISLFSALSYDNLSQNILVLGIAGGVMNAVMKNILIGHMHSTDFLYGMLASIVGVEIIKDSNELDLANDMLYPEFL